MTRGAARPSTAPTCACRCTREMLTEAAASLLPDAVRPAFVWDLRLDGDGR